MLILNRRPNERVMIGDNIIIKVIDIVGDQVSIGISAPDAVNVDREEIYYRKKGMKTRRNSGIGSRFLQTRGSVVNQTGVV